MKSRKDEYYIACYNYGEMYLRKKTGFILDDGAHQYGMCRGEDGLYRITDITTGALLNIPTLENYSVARTYIQLQRFLKNPGNAWMECGSSKIIEKWRGKSRRSTRRTHAGK